MVDVFVQDQESGLPIRSLKKDDFRILDNGHPVPIVSFDSGAHFDTTAHCSMVRHDL